MKGNGINYGYGYVRLMEDWNKKEGVFKGHNGKWLVRIRKPNGIHFNTISQHGTEEEAVIKFNEYKNENK